MNEDDLDDDAPTPTRAPTASGGLAAMGSGVYEDPLAGLDPATMMSQARQFTDPDARRRAAVAGMLKPKKTPFFSEALGNALTGYNSAADKEAELVARYLPVVQRAALARQQAKLAADASARQALVGAGASALMDPNLSYESVMNSVRALVGQGRASPQAAANYLRTLPEDPEQLRAALRQQALAATDPYRAVSVPKAEKLGEGQRLFTADPVTGVRTQVAAGAPKVTDFGRLIAERDALPPGDPKRAEYDAKILKERTSTPLVNINPEKPLINSFMGELGAAAGQSRSTASSAKDTLLTADRLLQALSDPRVITGPAAEAEVLFRQVAEVGRWGGKDNQERLAATRNAIQAMAQLELDAAAQMRGQGSITDTERKLLAKAASGSINMTRQELQELASIARRRAMRRINSYNEYARRLSKLPGMEQVAPLLEIDTGDIIDFDSQGRPK